VPNEASELREVSEDTEQIEEGDIPVAEGIDGADDPLKGIDLKDLAERESRKPVSKKPGSKGLGRVKDGQEFPPLK
jgi:hypothetical protein